jgi:hypothetical protein
MNEPFELRKEVALDATPEQVWEAIATAQGLAAWFMPMPVDPASELVTTWDVGRRLVVSMPESPDGSTQAFEYRIDSERGGRTVLRFVHSGIRAANWEDEYEDLTGAGWDMYLFTLQQYFDHFAGRTALYIEAEGPAGSTSPSSWPPVVAAVAGAAPTVGATVRIELAGTGTVDGTIDYATDHYLGFRTDDSLVRFHDRTPIGMTIAVSEHVYGRPVGVQSASADWALWLAHAITQPT